MWRLNPGRVLLPLRGVRAASGGGPAELATVSIGGIEAPLHRYRVLVCGTLLLYSSYSNVSEQRGGGRYK